MHRPPTSPCSVGFNAMAHPDTDIRYIKGIGETRANALNKLGIRTLEDLLSYFPRRWEDRTLERPIRELAVGEYACVRAMLASDPTASRISGGRTLVKVRAVDDSGALDVAFFNQDYRRTSLHKGETYIFYGKVEGDLLRRRMTNPVVEPEGRQLLTGRIRPPVSARPCWPRPCGRGWTPAATCCRTYCRMRYAAPITCATPAMPMRTSTSPTRRRRWTSPAAVWCSRSFSCWPAACSCCAPAGRQAACKNLSLTPFYDALPFALTGAQRRAVEQAVSDMTSGRVMNRLCQGDVGSGKTMVAAACVWFAARNGWQSALMAPTEILARQHYENLAPLFARFGLHCALLTGSTRVRERRAILAGLADGTVDLCIGTHALLTEDVQYARLGLVITDEQHRFGVDQRAALSKKADSPHMLVLSATPIPRTLALIIYGDLDVSIIDELPPGRQKVDTFAVGESYRQRLNGFIRKQVAEGHQVFIVCPLVAEDDQLPDERKAVTAYAQKLQNEVFPDLRISVLHGRMKSREKESVMAAFAAGESDILVSTTVVEVGVDVPNANLMVVENAERFGLSQLHQLRRPRQCQELVHPAVRQRQRRHPPPSQSADGDQRWLPHLRGRPEAPRPRRLFRPAAARAAHPEGCGSQLRRAAAGRSPVRGPRPADAGPPAGRTGPRSAAAPHPAAVCRQ